MRRSRYRRSVGQQALGLLLVVALVAWRYYFEDSPQPPHGASSRPHASGASTPGANRPGGLSPGEYRVERVVDGDTLMLTTPRGTVRVRLQGVNTPETVKEDSPVEAWGPEATAFTRDFIRQAGGRVTVEVDGEPRDQYDRFLAFLWSGETLLNEELVRRGLAQAKLGYDYSQAKKDRLRAAQREAQRTRRGLWSSSAADGVR